MPDRRRFGVTLAAGTVGSVIGGGALLSARGDRFDITVTLFSLDRFNRVFGDATRSNTVLTDLLALARDVDGLHLDFEIFEALPASTISAFRQFCVRLRNGLAAADGTKSLSAFGVMGAASNLCDAATIGVLDHLVVHGYDWPTETAAIGSPTRSAGVEMTYALLDPVLLPGITVSALTLVAAHGLQCDPASGSPYVAYQQAGGGFRQAWFEDARTLAAKFDFVRQQGLAGVAMFPIGYDAGAFDTLLRSAFSAA